VDAPVLAALITAGAALVVAVGNAVRAEFAAATERRYQRRRAFLIDAQDAALALRNALRVYGVELERRATGDVDGDDDGSFALAVTDWTDDQVARARGRLEVAQSRVEDDAVRAALHRWAELARRSMIGREEDAAAEQAAFDEVNRRVGAALQATRGLARRSGRG
jgi:hypothetical protein